MSTAETVGRVRKLVCAAIVLSACSGGSSDDVDPPSTATIAAPIEVGALLEIDAPAEVAVTGYIVWDSSGARLCEVLMESFPPQCGGAAVLVANPETLTFELAHEQSTRWTDDYVTVTGTFDGAVLNADE